MKLVTFNKRNVIKHFIITSKYNYNKKRKRIQKRNRQLSRIEIYMRNNHLLMKYELLETSKSPLNHIRGDVINFICHERKWIRENRYLKIVH